MKTKLENGARTPEVIAEELKKVGKLEAVIKGDGGLIYHYYTTSGLADGLPVIEVTYLNDKAIAIRRIPLEAYKFLYPRNKKIDDNFTFGGF